MNTEYLKEFVVLAETRNFWEASERLYMNQSTLSKHIRALEKELDTELFTRTTRRVKLTAYGQSFLPYARSIVKAEHEGCAVLQQLKNVENGLLTIASIPSMPQYRITRFLSLFQQKYPNATIRITEDDPSNLVNYLRNESCELIFLREDKAAFEYNFLNDPLLKRIPYEKDRMVVLMQKTHPLAGEKTINIKQLKEEQFCLIKDGSLMYDISMSACQNAGFIPNIIFTSHSLPSIFDMVSNQNCVALLMDKHVSLPENNPAKEDSPLVAIPISPEINSQISLCYRTDKPLSAVAQQFVNFCSSELFI